MTTDADDVNRAAARVIAQATGKYETPLPPDAEAAWREWSAGIVGVDTRTMTLLRAAFEAGIEVGAKQATGR